jgi:uncharacterized protein YjbI with pentapeptide repeats
VTGTGRKVKMADMDSQIYFQELQSKRRSSKKQYEVLKPYPENIAEKDSQLKSQEQQSKKRFSQEQYEMLKRCSENKDTTEWNKWRHENPHETILLEGAFLPGAELRSADLKNAHLEGAILIGAHLEETNLFDAYLEGINLGRAHLVGANLKHAHLRRADLFEAHLEGADLLGAYLEEAILLGAHLEGADLFNNNMEGVNLGRAHLEGANLKHAHLQDADLFEAHLEDANLKHAHLEGAILIGAHLEGANLSLSYLMDADFSRAIVDGKTLLWECEINRYTCFEGVGLDTMRIYPKTKQLLEYNIRRMNWEDWYSKKNKSLPELCNMVIWLMKRLVHFFWAISDYGISTGRIIVSFFGFAFVFAAAYRLWPDLVAFNSKANIQDFQNFFHAFYFSVVSMTTLGFADIAANPNSWQGQLLLMAQVILGYVFLGALVTRLAVLFTSGGPAGDFTE